MENGSPVYRREKQRVIFGLVTKRQRNIIFLGLVICLFFINHHQKNLATTDTWLIKAVPSIYGTSTSPTTSTGSQDNANSINNTTTNPTNNSKDVWGALPDKVVQPSDKSTINNPTQQIVQGNVQTTIDNLKTYNPPLEVYGSAGSVYLKWPENDNLNYKYEIYRNGELIDTIRYGAYVFKPVKKASAASSFDSIYAIKIVVFLFFLGLAFIDYNGTDLEVYFWRMIHQYYVFKPIFKVPFIGLAISLPVKKQNYFRLWKGADLGELIPQKTKYKKAKPIQELVFDRPIEKIFTSISQPIVFSSKSKAIEIEHPNVIVILKRDTKGGLEIAFRDR
ncbi:MAG: hypothetical protein JWM44_2105 [Bacilli bacterium]|nr:hypothetical protein [Bacilli bacterium]